MNKEQRKESRIEKYNYVKSLVDEKGVTFAEFQRKTGLENVNFTDWKNGRSMPKVDKLVQIANYFDVPLERLIV